MKKLMSLLTVLTLVLSMLAITAMNTLAAGEAVLGSGTEADPYLIGSKEALAAFAAAPADGAYYKLTADIVWSDYKQGGAAPAASNWTPITFNGTFDGNGHTVSGLYFNDPAVSYVGFFGVANGVIKNLTVKDSTFTGKSYVAGIVAGMESSEDKAAPATLTVENCVNYADVFGEGNAYFLAGIVESNYGTVRSCVNFGNIGKEINYQCGGIICDNEGLVENCMNFGSVTGTSTLGGIIGFAQSDSKIQNCYFNSDVFSGNAIQEDFNQNSPDIVNVK